MTAASPPSSPQAEVTEHFQPIPLRFGSSPLSRVAFKLRCVVDLQLGSIWSFIGPKLALLKGNLLDVGCGEMPYRTFLPKHIDYVGIDVPQAGAFSMQGMRRSSPLMAITSHSRMRRSTQCCAQKFWNTRLNRRR